MCKIICVQKILYLYSKYRVFDKMITQTRLYTFEYLLGSKRPSELM